MEKTYAFFDIETTGFDPDTDEIIEIGVIVAGREKVFERYSTLVKPGRKLPPRIERLTGISDRMLEDAPELGDVRDRVLNIIGSLPVVGHNVAFDIGFINHKFNVNLSNMLLDSMDFAQVVMPRAASYRLEALRDVLGLTGGSCHRAMDDAESACRLFFKCLEMLADLNRDALMNIYRATQSREEGFARVMASEVYRMVSEFPADKSRPLYAFLQAEDAGEQNIFAGTAIPGKGKKLGLEGLAEVLKPNGPFAEKLPQFKFRSEQVEMLNTVVQGFQQEKHMVIEAGTGTGKSLAYLIPAVAWAQANKTKVAVATHTINLQEQLWYKDLPTIMDVLDVDFKAALIKGRSNYLCLRRWEAKLHNSERAGIQELVFLMKVLYWLTGTRTGDKAEINILPNQSAFWTELSSEQDSCMGPACSWFHRYCFVSKARRLADAADLLIANHSVLLADVKLQNRLLPAYDYLIIDEAHHLEDTATEQLGWTISINATRQALFYLNRGYGSGLGPGLLNQLKQTLKNNSHLFDPVDFGKLDTVINESFERVKEIHESVDEIEGYLRKWRAHLGDGADEENFQVVRIKNKHRNEEIWEIFAPIKDNFLLRIGILEKCMQKILQYLEDADEQRNVFASARKDIEFQMDFLREVTSNFIQFYSGPEEFVYWLETDKGGQDIKIRCAPVSVSQLLYEGLFRAKKSTLMTSATVSVDGSFSHFVERIGLAPFGENGMISRLLSSPFSYEEQSLLCVVRDMPDPAAVSESEYVDSITPVIGSIVRILGGKTLVLFTAHKMLREVYFKLQPELEHDGFTLLGHKIDGGRTRLTEEFRKSEKAVLFGSSSFWEGIDLPGSILKCVIIVRLPFSPPNSPVVEARIEEMAKAKKDAFYNYTVPEAVIKLKQGFGRLIRTEEDEGVVVVLDRRISDRRYGRKFLNSLPIKTHFKGDTLTVLQKISDWLEGERPHFPYVNLMENARDIEEYLRSRGNRQGKKRS